MATVSPGSAAKLTPEDGLPVVGEPHVLERDPGSPGEEAFQGLAPGRSRTEGSASRTSRIREAEASAAESGPIIPAMSIIGNRA